MRNVQIILFFALLFLARQTLRAQNGRFGGMQNMTGRMRSGMGGMSQGKADSLQRRKDDSINIKFRYLDSSRFQFFDSSVKDFTLRYPIQWSAVTLGNFGNAVENRFFSPIYRSGWDHGFHSYDAYQFQTSNTRFYNTSKPYTEMGYMIGSGAEQMIDLLHTQNIKPNWNAAFQYRLINAPGGFQNQNTNHNNYRFTSWYQSKRKRYQNFLVIIGNKLQSAESGGILTDGNYIDSSVFGNNRLAIPTQLGGSSLANRNFFSTTINSGSFYTTASYLFRQQYDVGQKDSLVVNDSVTIPLFYPRLRFEHTISYGTYHFRFRDKEPDSSYYKNNYGWPSPFTDASIFNRDLWKEWLNDLSIYTFPDAKNPEQFLKLGASFQQLNLFTDTFTITNPYQNFWVHGEYRNKTRNKKWDLEVLGNFYPGGYNSGDYRAFLSLQRNLTKSNRSLRVGFENVNRRPSFLYDQASDFNIDRPSSLNKENHLRFFGTLAGTQMQLSAQYQVLSNYTYLKNYFQVEQAASLFTVLQLSAYRDFVMGHKGWHFRSWALVQQKTGSAELNLPLIGVRGQLAYDGSLGFRNLRLSTGLEFRYFSPYRANNYSPVNGQFFYQDVQTVRMRRPELHAYLHFRIRNFAGYVRAENLNALDPATGQFVRNNFLLPNYPSPGLLIRVGIFWGFVN